MTQTIGLNISLESLETSAERTGTSGFGSVLQHLCAELQLLRPKTHFPSPLCHIYCLFWKDASSVHAATGEMCRSLPAEHKGEFLQVSAQFTNI